MPTPRGPMYFSRPGGRRYRPVVRRLTVAMSGALAVLAAAVLCLTLAAFGEDRVSWFSLAAFAVLAAAVGAWSRPVAAPVVALASWLLLDGFVAHRYGGLGWSGAGVELPRLALLAGAALAAALPAALPRRRVRAAVLHLAPVPEQLPSRW